MKAAKVDANQGEIVDALRAMGASVQSLARVGVGCPDLAVGWRGKNLLLEVKMPGEKFTPAQKTWHEQWRGLAHVVQDVSGAIAILRAYS